MQVVGAMKRKVSVAESRCVCHLSYTQSYFAKQIVYHRKPHM